MASYDLPEPSSIGLDTRSLPDAPPVKGTLSYGEAAAGAALTRAPALPKIDTGSNPVAARIRQYALDSSGGDEDFANFAVRIAKRESTFNETAVSPPHPKYGEARGSMQVIRDTFKSVGGKNWDDWQDVERAGVRYALQNWREFNRDPRLTAAAYHAGTGAVRKAGGIPDTKDQLGTRTARYVFDVTGDDSSAAATAAAQDGMQGGRREKWKMPAIEGTLEYPDAPEARKAPVKDKGLRQTITEGLSKGVETAGVGMSTLIGSDPAALASQIKDTQIPRSPQEQAFDEQTAGAAKAFDDAKGFGATFRAGLGILGVMARNPKQAAGVVAQSLGMSAPGFAAAGVGAAAGSVIPGVGTAVGAFVGYILGNVAVNVQIETAQKVEKMLAERGVDTNDAAATQQAIEADPEFYRAAREAGIKSGVATGAVEGAVDLATAGLAGKAAAFVRRGATTGAQVARGAAAGVGAGLAQGASEGAGSIAGQAASGEPISLGQAATEAAYGTVAGVPDIAMAFKAGAGRAQPPEAPPGVDPVDPAAPDVPPGAPPSGLPQLPGPTPMGALPAPDTPEARFVGREGGGPIDPLTGEVLDPAVAQVEGSPGLPRLPFPSERPPTDFTVDAEGNVSYVTPEQRMAEQNAAGDQARKDAWLEGFAGREFKRWDEEDTALGKRPDRFPGPTADDAGIQPGDMLFQGRRPFMLKSGAEAQARQFGGQVVPVKGGFAVRPPPRPEPATPRQQAMARPEIVAELQTMASLAGWEEIGGRMIRPTGDDGIGSTAAPSRTKWIPRDAWWSQMANRLPKDTKGDKTKALIEKAVAGEPLTALEGRVLDEMIGHAEDYGRMRRGEIDEFGTPIQPREPDESAGGMADPAPDEMLLDPVIETERDAIEAEADLIAEVADDDELDAFIEAALKGEGGMTDAELQAWLGPEPARPDEAAANADGAQGAVTEGTGGGDPVRRPEAGADRPGAQQPEAAGGLTQPTPEDLRAKDAAKKKADAKKAAEDKAPPASDFTLTGSNRPADIAAANGQQELAPAPAPAAPGVTPGARARLRAIAKDRGIMVDEGGVTGFRADGGVITIPEEDQETEGAITPDHVFAHELAHALMDKRQLSFKGLPVSELRKRAPNWDDIVAVSKAFRPAVWNHKNERISRHARKPNEILADAIGSVLLGDTPFSMLQPMFGGALTERDLGLHLFEKEASAPAAPPKQPLTQRANDALRGVKPAAAPAPAPAPAPAAAPPKGDSKFAGNKVFTQSEYDKARALLLKKLSGGTLNAGLDPEVIQAGIQLAGAHIEAGARTFASFVRAMVDDLGDVVRPYLKGWYLAAKNYPGFDAAGMDKASVVEDADVDALAAAPADEGPTDSSGPLSAPERAFVDAAAAGLAAGTLSRITDVRRIYEETAGQKAEGWHQKRADELTELAVVQATRDTIAAGGTPAAIYDRLVTVYGTQPILGTRTSTSVEQQAYSTPSPLAYLAQRLAGVTPATTVYEPTAGTGMLVTAAAPKKAFVNEMNDDRAGLLEAQGFTVTRKDASSFDPGAMVDAVIANPPFGVVRVDGEPREFSPVAGAPYTTREIDHAIAFQALESMKEDGRAVLIVGSVNPQIESAEGRADAYNGKSKREFYYHLYRNYNVTQHLTVSGDLYKKQGAAWPVDVIVIEGRGKSALKLPAVQAPAVYDSWDALKGLLNDADRVDAGQPAGDGGRAGGAASAQPGADTGLLPGVPGNPGATPGGSGGGSRGGRGRVGPDDGAIGQLFGNDGPEGRGGVDPGVQQPGTGGSTAAGRDSAGGVSPAGDVGQGARGDGAASGPVAAGSAAAGGDRKPAGPSDLGTNSNQVGYAPASEVNAIGTLMPVNMREAVAQALAALRERVGPIDAYVARELGYELAALGSYFGAEQVDALGLALDSMSRGAGFIIGDQCVAGDTPIHDPVAGTTTPIRALAEAGKPIHVVSLTRAGWRPMAASAPFHKGRAELFRFTFDDGESIVVTGGHRFLTLEGWRSLRDGVGLGDYFVSVASSRDVLSLDSVVSNLPPCALEGGLRWTHEAQDSQVGCPNDRRSCDARLQSTAEADQGSAPSRDDALGHTRCCSPEDDRGASEGRTRPNLLLAPLAKTDSFPSASHGPSRSSSQERASFGQELPTTLRGLAPSLHGHAAPHPEAGEVSRDRLAGMDRRSSASVDHTGLRRLVSVVSEGEGDFFDMKVPGAFNYVAAGVVNHNTGIGKGRVVAGVIRWALKNGKTPIFVTEKPNLYGDMYRDLTDIGVEDIRPVMTNQSEKIPLDEEGKVTLKPMTRHNERLRAMAESGQLEDANIIFTTYSQMQFLKGAPTVRNEFLSRMAQDGVVIFDESHNAGGQDVTSRNKRRNDDEQPAKQGRAGFARRIAGLASGVFYSSATWAKRPEVMDLYFKTDMALAVGGKVELLAGAIQAGGVPLQQVVSAMLAKAGQYIRRERSFNGVEYSTTETAVDHKAAEAISRVMLEVARFDKLKKAAVKEIDRELRKDASTIAGEDSATGQAGATSTNFTSIMHNLIDQMLLSLKTDAAVDLALQELRAGKKVVLTVANTMGSFIGQYAEDFNLQPGNAVGMSFRSLLTRYLERSRLVTIKDADGNKTKRPLTDAELGPEALGQFRAVERLIRSASGLDTPPISPIDYLHNKLRAAGYKTGEITGRTEILNYGSIGGPTYETRKTADVSIAGRRRTISGFNGGSAKKPLPDADRLDVIVLNQSGSTGLSLHASKTFADQRPRRMLIVQAEKNIDTHMQMLGRIHRTGQVVLPGYFQLVADVPAEKRPAAVLAKKMASLNASTTANRKSAVTSDTVVDFMNDYGDEVAAQLMEDMPDIHEMLGKPLSSDGDKLARENAVAKVTGRIPLLPLADQEAVYGLLESNYKDLVEQADAMGQNMLEAKTMELDARVRSKTSIFAGSGDSPFAADAFAEVVDVKRLGKPPTAEQALAAIATGLRQAGVTVPDADVSRVEPLSALGRRVALDTLRAVNDKFRAFHVEMLAATDSEEGQAAVNARLMGMSRRFDAAMRQIHIGGSYRLQLSDGASVMAYVTGVRKKDGVKNPVAPGAWQITFAVADAARSFKLPLSKLLLDGESGEFKVGITAMVRDPITGQTVAEALDAGQSVTRESRVMMTGNLLAAFSKLSKGQIVNYTDDKGAIQQGILMPRGFDLKKAAAELPIEFTPETAARFLRDAPGRHSVATADGAARVMFLQSGDVRVMTEKSKQAGGPYFLDQQLRQRMGDDFVSRGSSMSAISDTADLRSVLARVAEISGQPLQTSSFRDEAAKAGGKTALDGTATRRSARPDIARNMLGNLFGARPVASPSRAQEDALAALRVALEGDARRAGMNPDAIAGLRVSGAPFSARPIVAALKKAFGLEVVFVGGVGNLPSGLDFNGLYVKGDRTIYVAADSPRPFHAVIGHEFLHWLENTSPDAYEAFKDAVAPVLRARAANSAARRYGSDYAQFGMSESGQAAAGWEELYADTFAEAWSEPAFWTQAINAMAPSLVSRLMGRWTAFVLKVKMALGMDRSNPLIRDLYTDFATVKQAVTAAMAGASPAAGLAGRTYDPMNSDIRFSLASDGNPTPGEQEALKELSAWAGNSLMGDPATGRPIVFYAPMPDGPAGGFKAMPYPDNGIEGVLINPFKPEAVEDATSPRSWMNETRDTEIPDDAQAVPVLVRGSKVVSEAQLDDLRQQYPGKSDAQIARAEGVMFVELRDLGSAYKIVLNPQNIRAVPEALRARIDSPKGNRFGPRSRGAAGGTREAFMEGLDTLAIETTDIAMQDSDVRRSARSAPPIKPAVAAAAGPRGVQAFRDWFNAKTEVMGHLPDRVFYLSERYKTLGKIERYEDIAKGISKAFADATEADKKELYTFFTTAGAKEAAITRPELRKVARDTKDNINAVGDALESLGMFGKPAEDMVQGKLFASDRGTRRFYDQYLPRLYLSHLLNEGDWRAIGAGKRTSDMGYLKKRQDIPEEVRRVILGEVKDPAFLAGMAIVRPMRDVSILRFLESISERESLVMSKSMVTFDGHRVTPMWLKREADRLRNQSRYMEDRGDAVKAEALAARMDAVADPAMEALGVEDHTDWKQLPDSPRYGRMRGLYVRKEVHDDLIGVYELQPEDMKWWQPQSFLGYGGVGTKATQLWKVGKVTLNPGSQVRNIISNMVMLQLSGVAMHRLPGRIVQAMTEIANDKGAGWDVAKKYGAKQATFASQELMDLKRDAIRIQLATTNDHPIKRIAALAALMSSPVLDKARDIHQYWEYVGKTAKIIDEMAKGKDEAEAAIEAQKWLFDYSLVSPGVRYLRNAPIGSPFLCVDEKTEALTKEGWKGIDAIAEGDLIAGYDMASGKLQWRPVSWIFRNQYEGKMLSVKDRHLDMMLTPDHRCVTLRRTRVPGKRKQNVTELVPQVVLSQDLNTRDNIPVAADFDGLPTKPIYSNGFVKAVGWFVTEGCRHTYCDQALISQNTRKAHMVREALTEAKMTWSEEFTTKEAHNAHRGSFKANYDKFLFHVHAKHGKTIFRALGNKKSLSPEFVTRLTREQLDLLIETMIDGDGCRSGSTVSFIQRHGMTLDSFKMALTLAGRSYGVHVRPDGVEQITMRQGRSYSLRRTPRRWIDYKGRVWCPQVDELTTWVARRNGKVFVTGNTWLVKAAPRLAEVVMFHPQRLLPWIGLYYSLPMLAAAAVGGDEDDWDAMKESMAAWAQKRSMMVPVPWRDSAGRIQFTDLGPFLPWTMFSDAASAIGKGDVAGAATGVAGSFISGGPIGSMLAAVATGGVDPFTDRPIVPPGEPTGRAIGHWASYLWTLWAPPWVTESGFAGKMTNAMTGSTNKYGDPRTTAGQAAATLVGLNLYGVNPDTTFALEATRMQKEIADVRIRMVQTLQDRGLSPERRKEIVLEYTDEMRRRAQKLEEYLSRARTVSPELKVKMEREPAAAR
jgi:hypothetical protein